MLGQEIVYSFFLPGTLSANHVISFKVPADYELVHESAVAQNNSDATLKLGTSADDDGFITAHTIGDSGVPVEKERADFNGALLTNPGQEFPRCVDGTTFVATLDFDGSAGTAAQNVTLAFTFKAG